MRDAIDDRQAIPAVVGHAGQQLVISRATSTKDEVVPDDDPPRTQGFHQNILHEIFRRNAGERAIEVNGNEKLDAELLDVD